MNLDGLVQGKADDLLAVGWVVETIDLLGPALAIAIAFPEPGVAAFSLKSLVPEIAGAGPLLGGFLLPGLRDELLKRIGRRLVRLAPQCRKPNRQPRQQSHTACPASPTVFASQDAPPQRLAAISRGGSRTNLSIKGRPAPVKPSPALVTSFLQ